MDNLLTLEEFKSSINEGIFDTFINKTVEISKDLYSKVNVFIKKFGDVTEEVLAKTENKAIITKESVSLMTCFNTDLKKVTDFLIFQQSLNLKLDLKNIEDFKANVKKILDNISEDDINKLVDLISKNFSYTDLIKETFLKIKNNSIEYNNYFKN